MVIVTTEPVCANCDHKRSKHQLIKTSKRPCLFVKRNGRAIEPQCTCPDYVDAASPEGAAILADRAEKARALK